MKFPIFLSTRFSSYDISDISVIGNGDIRTLALASLLALSDTAIGKDIRISANKILRSKFSSASRFVKKCELQEEFPYYSDYIYNLYSDRGLDFEYSKLLSDYEACTNRKILGDYLL